MIVPILQMTKLRLRQLKSLVQGHTARCRAGFSALPSGDCKGSSPSPAPGTLVESSCGRGAPPLEREAAMLLSRDPSLRPHVGAASHPSWDRTRALRSYLFGSWRPLCPVTHR